MGIPCKWESAWCSSKWELIHEGCCLNENVRCKKFYEREQDLIPKFDGNAAVMGTKRAALGAGM